MNQHDLRQIEPLNQALMKAWGPNGNASEENQALRSYLETRTALTESYRMFEIANHRIFSVEGGLVVPYDAHGLLIVFLLEADSSRVLYERKFPHGTVFTDRSIAGYCGMKGEAIDLEERIYRLEADDMQAVSVHRLRDLAQVLERINQSGSRYEVVYLLRFLVARLCTSAYRSLAGAKNLQPEIVRVRKAILEFLQGPFATRLGLPTRVLVRHISGLVTRPRLIERVWQDTIDLCEVHVRGSSIANEIRRSCHHSLGWQTLELARAYEQWLHTGEATFPDPEHMVPAEADQAARQRPDIVELAERIAHVLEQLLGGDQIAHRIEEWRVAYAGDLQRCGSGATLCEEAAAVVEEGAVAGNRWVYQQHLRVIDRMLDNGGWQAETVAGFKGCLESLREVLPGDQGFDAIQSAEILNSAVELFLRDIRARHQDDLFTELDELLEFQRSDAHLEVFLQCSRIRHRLDELGGQDVFETQGLLLYQLDCLLEETGYYALRHVAHAYGQDGMNLPECLDIVRRCAVNLVLNGLFSRELWDLSLLLVDPGCSNAARLDVLEQLQRNYHRLVRRVSEAYEVMADHLGYGEDEMRGVLGNFFRSMHDLNNLAHFSDAARAWIASGQDAEVAPGGSITAVDPWDFQHLSHDRDIVGLVEDPEAKSLRDVYGGKGSGLIYLSYLGVPTRDAFIIPSIMSRQGLHQQRRGRLERESLRHLRILERDISRDDGRPVRLGDPSSPLLLAIRGGSVFSMPGQLETIVFVGMTWDVAEALAEEDEWYAWDAFRRFLASYAESVWQIDLERLDLVDRTKLKYGVAMKTDLSGEAMREIVEKSRDAISEAGHGPAIDELLRNPELQLHTAIQAVCNSWEGQRARRYRQIKHLSDHWHTAVIVQQMAAGNRSTPGGLTEDETGISLTGVIPRTRMEHTGFRSYTGDIKFGASGDDLVGGLVEAASFEPAQNLHDLAPMLDRRINHINSRIRRFMGTDAEIEFTVEQGVLSVLQTRSAETEHMFEPRTFHQPGPACGRGIGVMGGAFRGLAAFSEEQARQLEDRLGDRLGRDSAEVDGILLVLENPVPDEIPLILSVDGLLAARGGSTAHAAVAVNGIDDKPFSAVLGVAHLRVLKDSAEIIGPEGEAICRIEPGDIVSIHGQTGEVFTGSRDIYE